MNVRRALVIFAFLAGGCVKHPETAKPVAEIGPMLQGFWVGMANKSPLGMQPYAILFETAADGGTIGETPSMLSDEPLPPGAYQRFVFSQGAKTTQLKFQTSMGAQGVTEGELALLPEKSTASRLVYSEGPGSARGMELRFEAIDPGSLSLQVWFGTVLHADILLRRELPTESAPAPASP